MSMEEYVNAYYGGTLGISKRYGLVKSDDPVNTTTHADGLNTMYGAKVYANLNQKSEVFKLLKKEPWTQSGWRALKARHTTTNGVAESGDFPLTDRPDIVEMSADVKEIVTPWEMSSKAEILSETDDGLGNLGAFMRKENSEAHQYYIDAMLLRSFELKGDEPAATGTGVAGNALESLDRVTATITYSTDAQSPAGAISGAVGAAATDLHGMDSSGTGSWFDAGYTHFTADGSNDALALADIDTGIAALLENGVNYNNLILLTGYDTYQDLKALMAQSAGSNGAWNYDLKAGGAGSMNGVTGEAGLAFDSRVGSYDGIPIFLSQHVPSDGVSRMYLLDMENLAFRVAAPTTYVDNTNLAVRQKLTREYALITAGELICYNRITQGSIRDLA